MTLTHRHNQNISTGVIFLSLFLFGLAPCAFAANITATLDEAAARLPQPARLAGARQGVSVFAINDSAAVEQCHIDSDGNAVFKGCLRPACLLVISAGRVDSGGSECTVSEGLVIDGNVGIGTTSPQRGWDYVGLSEFLRVWMASSIIV